MTLIGQTISHYRIMDKLGAGGMGEVYLAEDTSLHRKVALKFLPAHLRQDDLVRKRFLREAESAAALEHPYICNIKEVSRTEDGQDFIVMEYVSGQTLKDRLQSGPRPLSESLQICRQVADALALAHGKGIVHRDLKPANIMLTQQGHAKVMDFGLAKRVATKEAGEQDLTTGLTREGYTLGTPAYMSPEQVKSEPADPRSDLFSLGIVLYEMLTGVHPFLRGKAVETMGAILHEEPKPLADLLPGSTDLLQQTVSRLLAKDPDARFQTIEEVAENLQLLSARQEEPRVAALLRSRVGRRLALVLAGILVVAVALSAWWVFREPAPGSESPLLSSIVVLPLANLSGDPEQEYFVDGMTEALITDLSKIGALKVIARSSAMRYKGTDKSLAEIARELGVDAVVEGSVLREGDQVRITAQLIAAATESNLWAERYERNLTSILALQGEVAQAIARQIRVTLTPDEEQLLTGRREVNPEAYEAYLKGMSHWYKITPADIDTAQQYFELALEKDPDSVLAQVGIAMVWAGRYQMGIAEPRDARPKARAAALRAVELDETLAEAHYALACVRTWTDWDWEGAEASFQRAIDLNPNFADVRAYYSIFLMIMKRQDEALAQMKRALELDPFNPLFHALYAGVLSSGSRRYDEAIEQCREVLRTVPNHPVALTHLTETFYMKGMYEEALEAAKANQSARGNPEAVKALESGYAEGGFQKAMGRLADWEAADSTGFRFSVFGYLAAGRKEDALNALESAFDQHDPAMPYVGVRPYFDSLRDEPRYQVLLRRMNFPADVLAAYLSRAPGEALQGVIREK